MVGRGPEAALGSFVVKDLHFEGEVLFEVFDDHDQKRQLDSKRFFLVERSRDVSGTDIVAHDLQHRGLDVIVSDPLDVPVLYIL